MKNRSTNNKAEENPEQEVRNVINTEEVIRSFYRDHRDEFIRFGIKYGMDKGSLIDIFQDVVIIFFEQKEAGKIDQLNCTDKTYLFSLGKYKIIENLRKKKKNANYLSEQTYEVHINPEEFRETTLTERQKKLAYGLKQLGEKCRNLITLFYLRQLTISEIVEMMGYKNENVVKAHKSRCMKNLKENVSKIKLN